MSLRVKEASAEYRSGELLDGCPVGYKLTEVGVIPDDWEIVQLQAICRAPITYGIVQCGPHVNNGIPYIRVSDMNSNVLDVSGMLRTSKAIAASFSRSKVDEGDIVYALRGKLGEVRMVGSSVAGANLTQGTARVAPADSVSGNYLLWALRASQSIKQALQEAKGSTFVEITLSDLKGIKISIPSSINEQTAIANALSDVDALITSLETLITKKRAIKTAAMQQLLTGKKRLPPFDKIHTGYKQTEFGEIPEDWEFNAIGECFNVNAGGDLRKAEYSDIKTQNYSYPIYSNALTNEGLYGYSSTHDYDGEYITITARGSIGRAEDRIGRFCAIGRLLVLAPLKGLSCKYVAEFINQYLVFANESTGVPQLTAPQVAQYKIAFPTKDEQVAIATMLSEMDQEIVSLEKHLTKTQQLKQGMMQELLTGKTRLI